MTANQSQPSASGSRILVVDDEPDIVALVAYHVASPGYRVSTAANGGQALQTLRHERPVLVVLRAPRGTEYTARPALPEPADGIYDFAPPA